MGEAFLGGGGALILFQITTHIRKQNVITSAIIKGDESTNIVFFTKNLNSYLKKLILNYKL